MDLPAEIVTDILSRLPIKTIVHCTSVCKRWHILLSEAYFVSLHLSRSPIGLIGHRTKRGFNLFNLGELDDKFEYHELIDPCPLERLDLGSKLCWFLDSVNGLILYEVKVDRDYVLHICNPITREYIILPGDNCVRSSIDEIVTRGFGFVEASNQYKVVTLYLGSNKSECKIYTLGTGMWRSFGHLPFFLNGLQNGRVGGFGVRGTFFAGNLHWLAYEEDTHKEMIYTFDLERETFQLTDSAPQEYGDLKTFRTLGTLGNYLCTCDGTPDSDLVVIWMMKESWTKDIVINSKYDLYFVRPLNILKDRTILMLSDGCLFTYNLEYKTELEPVNKIFRDGLQRPWMDTFRAIVYVPSFVRLKSFTEEKVSLFSLNKSACFLLDNCKVSRCCSIKLKSLFTRHVSQTLYVPWGFICFVSGGIVLFYLTL